MNEIEKMYFKGIYDYLEKEPVLSIFYRKGYSIIDKAKPENLIALQIKMHSDYVNEYYFNNNSDTMDFVFEVKNEEDFMRGSEWAIGSNGIIIPTSTVKNAIGPYSPDFVICFGVSQFAIEIDGHNFHERTKEQVRQDNNKNRDYLKWGVIPIRFSGSEVYNNPIKCAEETFETIAQFVLHFCESEYGFIDNVVIPQHTEQIVKCAEEYCKEEV